MEKQNLLLKQKEEEFEEIMKAYLNVKQESLKLGFDEKGIKFRDFLDVYLSNNSK